MLSFPTLHSFQIKHIVGVGGYLTPHVECHQRQDHIGDRNFIQKAATTDEMRRGIDVRAPLTDVLVLMHQKASTERSPTRVEVVESNALLVWHSRCVRNTWLECMREIDEPTRINNFQNLP